MRNYTETQLKENYDKFISFVKKAFASQPERMEKLLFMYSEEQLGMELLMAPASGKAHFHSAYVGGYIDHVMNVCKNSIGMMKQFKENGGIIDFEVEELLFAALHHDLGKLGLKNKPYYIPNPSEWHIKNQGKVYSANPDLHHMTHTDRTIFVLQQYGIQISEAEYFGIKLTDGLYDEDNMKYLKVFDINKRMKYKIPYIMHWADHMSTVIESQDNTM